MLAAGGSIRRGLLGLLVGLVMLAGLTGLPNRTARAADQPVVHFVVDTSGSMYGQRLADAKTAVIRAAEALPAGTRVGLRSFDGNCGDITNTRLVVPVGTYDGPQFATAVNSLVAGGVTPIPEALQAAAADLPSSGQRSVVLISDGQSSCGDPCPEAGALKSSLGVDFRVHAVGLQVSGAAESQLRCVANTTGGRYISVINGSELADALGALTMPCSDVLFVGVRGSDQTASDANGYGEEVRTVKEYLRTQLPAGTSASYVPLDYQTESVSLLESDRAAFRTRYVASMSDAVDKLSARLQQSRDACGDGRTSSERWVLTGYSQGAAAVNTVARQLSAEELNRTSIVLIGDPLRSSRDRTAMVGSATASSGVFQLLPGSDYSAMPSDVRRRTQTLCSRGDLLCEAPDNVWARPPAPAKLTRAMAVHTSYATDSTDDLRRMARKALTGLGIRPTS